MGLRASEVLSTAPHWFQDLADHLGPAYLRYSFTRGTRQEVDALWELLGLGEGARVLDVGCGPGRHSHELAARGALVVGIDIAHRFAHLAASAGVPGAQFVQADARALPVRTGFDAAISLCQGAFGLSRNTPLDDATRPLPPPDPDQTILGELVRALRPGGRLALTAFSSYFQVRWLEDHDRFDVATGLNHERTTLRDEQGRSMETDLWTTCFTPRELALMAGHAGLRPLRVWSVGPGDYRERAPDLDHPELLLVAERS